LYVKEKWGIYWSPPSLWGYKRTMDFAFPVVWCFMGYVSKGERVVGEFERAIGTSNCFGSVEVGSFVVNVVCMVWAERKKLWR